MLVESTLPASDSSLPARPAVLQHLSIGINEVTKRLDAQIRSLRRCNVVSLNTDPATEQPPLLAPIKLIVVCRADVDPQILIDHLPHEVAAFNSAQPPEPIKIIPLPKGAEASLAAAAGFRRVAVIAMDVRLAGYFLTICLVSLRSKHQDLQRLPPSWSPSRRWRHLG